MTTDEVQAPQAEAAQPSAVADEATGEPSLDAQPAGPEASAMKEAAASAASTPAASVPAGVSTPSGNWTWTALGGLGLAVGAAAAGGGGGSSSSTGGSQKPDVPSQQEPETRPPVTVPGVSGSNGAGPIGQGGGIHVDVAPGSNWEFSTDGGQTWRPGQGSSIPAGELGEGSHNIIVVAIDDEGNRSEPTEITVSVDLTPPSQPPSADVSGAVGTDAGGTPIINGQGSISIGGLDPDADWEFSTDGGQTWHPGQGSGISAGDLQEGHNTIEVVQVDEAGNKGEAIVIEVIKDTVADAPQIEVVGAGSGSGQGSGGAGAGKPPAINGSGSIVIGGLEPNADWEFSTDGGQTWQPGQGSVISADQLQEGSNIIQVIQIDSAGNQSPPATMEVIKDTIPGEAPTLDVSVGVGNSTPGGTGMPPTINGTGSVVIGGLEPDADWAFSTDGGQTWQPGQGSGIPADQLQEGSNTIQVIQIDSAGNQSPPATVEVIKDTTPGPAPTLDVSGGAGNGTPGGVGIPPTINGTGSVVIGGLESDADWAFSTDGGQTWQPGQGNVIPADQLQEGSNTIQVIQIDSAGNQSSPATMEVIKDTTPGQAPTLDVSGGAGNDSSGGAGVPPTINGTGSVVIGGLEPDADWAFSTDGGQTWQPGQGSSIPADQLQEGSNTIQVIQIDSVGNQSPPATMEVIKDTIPGQVPTLDVSGGAGNGAPGGAGVPPTINGTGSVVIGGLEPNADWAFSTDGGQTWQPGQGGSISADQLNEGSNTIQVVQIDSAGNQSPPATIEVIKDTVVQAPQLDLVGAGSTQGGNTPPMINGSGSVTISGLEPNAEWQFSTDGGVTWLPGQGASIGADQMQEGSNTIQVVQIDAVGNQSAPATIEVIKDTVAQAPQLDVVGAGSTQGGNTPPMINGSGSVAISGLEPHADWQFSTDGGVTWQPGQGASIGADQMQEGSNTIQVVQIDAAGNQSPPATIEVIKDTVALAPQVDVVGAVNGQGGSGSLTPIINGAGSIAIGGLEPGADWAFSIDGGVTWQPGQGSGITVDQLNEGTNTIQVVQIDAVGNHSPVTTIDVILNPSAVQAPSLDITGGSSQPGGPGAGGPGVINGSGGIQVGGLQPGADWSFSTDGQTWTPGQGSSIPAGQLTEGLNVIQVVQIDGQGNQSEPSTIEVIKDTMALPPQVDVVGAGTSTGGTTPVINGTGSVAISGLEPNADWQFSTDGGVTWQPGQGSSITAGQLNEGSNTIQVVQIDAVGNQSPPATLEVIKDTTPGLAPQLNVIGAGYGQGGNTSPVINGSGSVAISGLESGAEWQFSTDGGVTWQPGLSGAITADQLSEGANAIQVVQIDVAGNQSPPAQITVIKDTVAPQPPQVHVPNAGSMPGGGAPIINGAGSVSIGGLEHDAQWVFSTDGGQTWRPGVGGSIAADQLHEGSNVIQVVQTDVAGNVSAPATLEVIKDTVVPLPQLTAVSSNNATENGVPLMGAKRSIDVGGLEAHATWAYSVDGVHWQAGSGTSIPVGALPEGLLTVQVVQTDLAGNRSAVASIRVVVDTTDPGAPTILSPADAHGTIWTGPSSPIQVGGLEVGSTLHYSTDGQNWTTVRVSAGGTFALDSSIFSGDGAHSLFVAQFDAAGNGTIGNAQTVHVIVDSQAPSVPNATIVGGMAGGHLINAGGSIAIGGLDNGTWQFSTDGGHTWTVGSGVTIAAKELHEGLNEVLVSQTDRAGNTSAVAQVTVVVDTVVLTPILSTSSGNGYLNASGEISIAGLEANSHWTFSLDNGKTWADGSGASIKSNQLQEGSNTVLVRQTDQAGNVSSSGALSVIKDTVIEPVVLTCVGAIEVNGRYLLNKGDYLQIHNLEPGGYWSYSLDKGASWYSQTSDYLMVNALREGTNDIRFKMTDAAGNVSSVSSIEVVKDTIVEELTYRFENPWGYLAEDYPFMYQYSKLIVSGVEAGAKWYYRVYDGSEHREYLGGPSFEVEMKHLTSNSNNSIAISQIDAAGNASTYVVFNVRYQYVDHARPKRSTEEAHDVNLDASMLGLLSDSDASALNNDQSAFSQFSDATLSSPLNPQVVPYSVL